MAENKSSSFESSLERLKAVVDELEKESVDLERSVELFQEGRTLVARCEVLLKNAEDTLRAADGDAGAPRVAARPDDDTPVLIACASSCLHKRYRVLLNLGIARDQCQSFDVRLCDHDAIERIAMNFRQSSGGKSVLHGDV